MNYTDQFDPEFLTHLHILKDHEQKIIKHYYGLEGEAKLNIPAIAELVRNPGVSATKIRSTVANCLIRLRGARDATLKREQDKDSGVRQEDSLA